MLTLGIGPCNGLKKKMKIKIYCGVYVDYCSLFSQFGGGGGA